MISLTNGSRALPASIDAVASPQIPISTIPPGEVFAELARILPSEDFQVSERNKRFLKFIVECSLKGRRAKGYDVAVEVFGRPASFNATSDPIVRIECGKLRKALEFYYLKSGRHNPLRITMPKGSYIAVFERAPAAGASTVGGSLELLRASLFGFAGQSDQARAAWSSVGAAYPSFPFDASADFEKLHGGDTAVRELLLEGLRRAGCIPRDNAPAPRMAVV
jgi:adenylate cyclase